MQYTDLNTGEGIVGFNINRKFYNIQVGNTFPYKDFF